MKKELTIEILSILIELKSKGVLPNEYNRDIDRCIKYLENEITKDGDSAGIAKLIEYLLKLFKPN